MSDLSNNSVTTDSNNRNIVNKFNNINFSVDSNQYDYVLSFFKSQMKDPDTAKNFTESLYQVSRQADLNILEMVDTLKGQTGLELTASIAYYLNGTRSPSTLLGVSQSVKSNFYAARNVLI